MSLSPDKSIAYATSTEFRGILRRFSVEGVFVPVANDFGDLGVQLCTRKASCAKGFQGRVDKNLVKLERLQVLPWSITKKVACLTRFVFPSAMCGSELSSVSVSALGTFQGKYNKAVRGSANQRNHFLAPLLGASEIYEPWIHVSVDQYYCFWKWFLRGLLLSFRGTFALTFAQHV